MQLTRRNLVALAAAAPFGVIARPLPASDAPCPDPGSLTMAQKSLRSALGYSDVSSDPKRRCGACAFFATPQGNCGSCQLMSGGPVNSAGMCNSFAPKAA